MFGGIASAVVSMIPAIMQMTKGEEQKAEGKAGLSSLQRPEYYNTMARMAYGDKMMPGETTMLDRNDLAAQNAYNRAKDSGNPMASLAAIQAMNQRGALNIGVQSAQNREADMLRMMQSLQTEFQMNKFAPYAEKSQEYRDMVGAGEKNQFSGVSNMAGIASSVLSNMNFGGNNSSNYDSAMAGMAGNAYKNKYGGGSQNNGGAGMSNNMQGQGSMYNYNPYLDQYDARYQMG